MGVPQSNNMNTYDLIASIKYPPDYIVDAQIRYVDRAAIAMIVLTAIFTAGSLMGVVYFALVLAWYYYMMKKEYWLEMWNTRAGHDR